MEEPAEVGRDLSPARMGQWQTPDLLFQRYLRVAMPGPVLERHASEVSKGQITDMTAAADRLRRMGWVC